MGAKSSIHTVKYSLHTAMHGSLFTKPTSIKTILTQKKYGKQLSYGGGPLAEEAFQRSHAFRVTSLLGLGFLYFIPISSQIYYFHTFLLVFWNLPPIFLI